LIAWFNRPTAVVVDPVATLELPTATALSANPLAVLFWPQAISVTLAAVEPPPPPPVLWQTKPCAPASCEVTKASVSALAVSSNAVRVFLKRGGGRPAEVKSDTKEHGRCSAA
jgi:hypothetical protein